MRWRRDWSARPPRSKVRRLATDEQKNSWRRWPRRSPGRLRCQGSASREAGRKTSNPAPGHENSELRKSSDPWNPSSGFKEKAPNRSFAALLVPVILVRPGSARKARLGRGTGFLASEESNVCVATRRLRQQPGPESIRLAALTGCILGCGVRTWRQGQQEVKQKQDGGEAAEGEQAPAP
jgi:hypothetical protein